VIPGYTNPQDLNRYSYVTNNPLRYTDPTGHRACGDGEDVTCGGQLIKPIQNAKSCSGDACHGKGGTKSNRNREKLVENMHNLAVASQDIATVIDGGFAILEVSFVAAGCAITSEAGCVEGAAAGLLLGQATFNVFGGNGAETGLSLASLVFTAVADGLEDNEFGEATTTSLATFGAGGLMLDPIGDLAIDGYASGYNHGIFNGIEAIISGGSLFH
jgi:hypothetical protein